MAGLQEGKDATHCRDRADLRSRGEFRGICIFRINRHKLFDTYSGEWHPQFRILSYQRQAPGWPVVYWRRSALAAQT